MNAGMPLAGLMADPFPEPGPRVRAAMEALQMAAVDKPEDEAALRKLAKMPRPWDPGSCTGVVRGELWAWLDEVVIWVNTQHMWNVTRPGVPECWPAHPHLVHDLAVLACGRYFAAYAVTPAALEEWQRYALPMFLDRLRDRLGDACQPGRHQPQPRLERDQAHVAEAMRLGREERFEDDVLCAGEGPGRYVTRPRGAESW